MVSQTGLWWNTPRNLGYMAGLTGEVRARAMLYQAPRDLHRVGAAEAADAQLTNTPT
jgi:hypothetical protein